MDERFSPRILVPLDGSKLARAALDEVLPLAIATGGSVSLVSVMEPVMDRHFEQFAAAEDLSITDAINVYLEGEAHGISEDLDRAVDYRLVNGFGERPGEVIAEYAKANDFDLIAMSTRGLSGFKRLILGSVARQVMESTVVPVLLYPAR